MIYGMLASFACLLNIYYQMFAIFLMNACISDIFNFLVN